jgi:DNA-directed RNA polymerase specialized sigma24 family protein
MTRAAEGDCGVSGADGVDPPPPVLHGEADAELYARLVADGFSGPVFEAAADRLIRYAYPILRAWTASGYIAVQCARRRVRCVQTLVDGTVWLSAEDVEDLTQETVSLALRRFVGRGRAGRGWAADGGASLTTFFVGGCVLAFGEVYARWAGREREKQAVETAWDEVLCETWPGHEPDPADVVCARDRLAHVLPADRRTRTAVLLAAVGYSHGEVAEMLGDGTSARAVEGLLYRYRAMLRGE